MFSLGIPMLLVRAPLSPRFLPVSSSATRAAVPGSPARLTAPAPPDLPSPACTHPPTRLPAPAHPRAT